MPVTRPFVFLAFFLHFSPVHLHALPPHTLPLVVRSKTAPYTPDCEPFIKPNANGYGLLLGYRAKEQDSGTQCRERVEVAEILYSSGFLYAFKRYHFKAFQNCHAHLWLFSICISSSVIKSFLGESHFIARHGHFSQAYTHTDAAGG